MFSDEEIKESGLSRPGDELISIHEVCLVDKYDKRDFGFNSEPLLYNSGRSNLDMLRYFRDGFLEGLDQPSKFAWTEEDGNIASLVSETGFGIGSNFGKDLDEELNVMKASDASSSVSGKKNGGIILAPKSYSESNVVSSTSGPSNSDSDKSKAKNACKIDKEDPRSRLHFVKYIKRHGRTMKLWECGICSREFQHQYTLMRHLPTHTDERNYHCGECSKSFRQLSTLSQHRAIHSADRPYACEVCNKTFNRVSTLISHRKTHSDEKPYKCHICPKGFHQKGNLRNHLFTHTNERPYRCNICNKGFNQQSNLVCHKNKAHPEEGREQINVDKIAGSSCVRPKVTKAKPLKSRRPSDCEVTSSMGPQSNSVPEVSRPCSEILPECSRWGGVVVDPIRTYHMGVAMATRQTPFALLQPAAGAPVLVKVVDTRLPGGKQMLVPATAEDLRVGGKIVVKNEKFDEQSMDTPDRSSLHIRVPVVATVVPRLDAGALRIAVCDPHAHTDTHTLTDGIGERNSESCISQASHSGCSNIINNLSIRDGDSDVCPQSASPYSPRAPSPPLYIPLDLFEPMDCMPMGPQITAVDLDQLPPSDDSDIFITKFEENNPLEDSD